MQKKFIILILIVFFSGLIYLFLTRKRINNIVVSGIVMKNFYINSARIDKQGDVFITENKKYSIVYFPKYNKFLISILASPFSEVMNEAEGKLLAYLGIEKKEACVLDISATTPYFANPSFSGKSYPLSFCRN